jgi:hypothetical protein
MVVEDGGVLTFGQAPFWASTGGNAGRITNIVAFPNKLKADGRPVATEGYAWVHSDGRLEIVRGPSSTASYASGFFEIFFRSSVKSVWEKATMPS